MTLPTPNLAGFKDAQRRLRSHFAELVTFHFPAVETWPVGTALDPETGRPYDPVVQPTTSVEDAVQVRCSIFFRALKRGGISGEASVGAAGWISDAEVMLIADIDERPRIEGAEGFSVRDGSWDIIAMTEDGIGEIQRWLVYGRHK